MTQIPANMNRHLDSLIINEDGGLLLSSSSLTNRSWSGSVWYYNDPSAAPDVERCDAGVEADSGISDITWISGSDRIAGATDSGAVVVWQLVDDRHTFRTVTQFVEHDDIVTTVDVSADNCKLFSAGHDHRVKVLDLEENSSVGTYKAHHDIVHCVCSHPTNSQILASTSQDNRLLLWDFRQSKPVSLIETQFLPSEGTCVTWQPDREHNIVVGTASGHLVAMDVRHSVGQPTVRAVHKRPITRLSYAPHKSHWLASASEDCQVIVTDTTSGVFVLQDTSHTDFVKGLSWNKCTSELWSCGWDQRVIGRSVSEVEGLSCPLATMEIEASIKSPDNKMDTDEKKTVVVNGHLESSSVETQG